MGQKILAYLFYGFLILMVIAALILLKYQLDHKEIKQQQIDSRANVVTRTESDKTTPNNSSTLKEPRKQEEHANPELKDKSSQPEEQNPLSYLDIYHQLQDANTCQHMFFIWQRDGLRADLSRLVTRPFSYYDDPAYAHNEKPPITAEQHKQLNLWRQKCQQLWQVYGDFDETDDNNQVGVNAISEHIEQRLNKTVAKTPHEIKLKEVLKITAQWQHKSQILDQAKIGEDSLSEAELSQINEQIKQLGEQRKQLRQAVNSQPDDQTANEALQEDINRINEEINRLHTLISEQKVKNPDKIEQLTAELNALDQRLFQFYNTPYGEVFYEVLTTQLGHTQKSLLGYAIGGGGRLAQSVTPVDLVLENNNLSKSRWYNPALSAATVLYLCDLGMDCAPNSPLMYEFCLGGYPANPDSCGLNAYDFYQHVLISPNHWPDVVNFIRSYEDMFHG